MNKLIRASDFRRVAMGSLKKNPARAWMFLDITIPDENWDALSSSKLQRVSESMRAHGNRSLKKQRSKAMAYNSRPNYQWFEILMRDVMHYGMGLLGSVPPKNATKTTSVSHHFVRSDGNGCFWCLFQSVNAYLSYAVSFSFLQSILQDLTFAVSFSLFQYKRSELCCKLLISPIYITRPQLCYELLIASIQEIWAMLQASHFFNLH
jgi:hypothetical protein